MAARSSCLVAAALAIVDLALGENGTATAVACGLPAVDLLLLLLNGFVLSCEVCRATR